MADRLGLQVADEQAHEHLGEEGGAAHHRHAVCLPARKHVLQRVAGRVGGAFEELAGELRIADAAGDDDPNQRDHLGIEEVFVQPFGDAVQGWHRRQSGCSRLSDQGFTRCGAFEHHGFEQLVLVAEQLVHGRQRSAGAGHDIGESRTFVALVDEKLPRGRDDRLAASIQSQVIGQRRHGETALGGAEEIDNGAMIITPSQLQKN